MQGTTLGIAIAVTLGVAVLAMAQQDKKMDLRSKVGTMPGGVTLYGSDKVTPLHKGLEVVTFGGG
ncbi:MAG TPA: hypothetical protein VNI20_11300 [Fimbriimonadaceae bacterium]|nr:hypothetical protein [Fimbriimonadaceae bacterium]